MVIVSPTTDIGAALREARNPRCLTAFIGQTHKLERSLHAASFDPRISTYTPMVDRAWNQSADGARSHARTIDLELIDAPQLDWFPYKNRRGIKL